ncbi:hypothetical protein U8V72_25445 [Priestia filamentosa]|uniref:hypothetical protein n=1 Tax=Priestia filamentosa TaxID=1402861 RepID=UPI00397D0ECF
MEKKPDNIEKNFAVFYTYDVKYQGENLKGMAVARAKGIEEAANKVIAAIDKDEYKNVHIWWTGELEELYEGRDTIIP